MDQLFLTASLKNLLKISTVCTDNAVFRLHYKLTALLLIGASIMVTGTQFFGDPIKCIIPEKFPAKLVETYCWIESTFTLPKYLGKEVGNEIVYQGVGKHAEGDEVLEHSYYQWVCFVLLLQGILFMIPHFLWKAWEGGKIKDLILELNLPVMEYTLKQSKLKELMNYFVTPGRTHTEYFFKYFMCEILNFANVVGQIYLVDKFLHGEFTTYGSKVFQFMISDQDDRFDPMIRVFPRMTKCRFHHFGPSGDVQKIDTYCVLPLNILNEKIYVMIWFWFVILSIFSGLAIGYRLVMVLWRRGRYIMLKSVSYFTVSDHLGTVLDYLDYGDWFVLYSLGNNIDNIHFKELIEEMAYEIRRKHPEEYLMESPPFMKDSSYEKDNSIRS